MRYIFFGTLALLAAACGSNPTSPSALPIDADAIGTALVIPGSNSCPHEVPNGWHVIGGDGHADFRWAPVPVLGTEILYVIEVREFETKLFVASWTVEHSGSLEKPLPGGRYEARIRTQVCGGDGQSIWSAWVDFHVDGPDTESSGRRHGHRHRHRHHDGDNGDDDDEDSCDKPGQPFPWQPPIDCPPGHEED